MKQTAVEYLDERFTYIKWMRDRDEISSETGLKWYNEAFEQAKQMEKEQIIDAHGNKTKKSAGVTNYIYTLTGEQYYNETYKQNKQ